jgi:osmoprotectant transport system permease protein
MIDFAWAADHLDDLAWRTVQHIFLAGVAVAVGFVVSLGLSIWVVRRSRGRALLLTLSSVLYTIPSLALFAALVPVTGLSILTAEIPLTLYTLVIFVRNILAGLDAVPADVIEAADAMGYSRRERLRRVELPLALPLVVGGLRLASVSTIGLVTVSGILGDNFGGLGFFIFEGYRRTFATEIWFGGIPVIVLAVVADVALLRLQSRLTPWARTHQPIDPALTAAAGAGAG